MRTLKDLEDAYSFMRDPVIWDAIQMIKERDRYVETLEAALRSYTCDCSQNSCERLLCGHPARAALAGEKKEQEWD